MEVINKATPWPGQVFRFENIDLMRLDPSLICEADGGHIWAAKLSDGVIVKFHKSLEPNFVPLQGTFVIGTVNDGSC